MGKRYCLKQSLQAMIWISLGLVGILFLTFPLSNYYIKLGIKIPTGLQLSIGIAGIFLIYIALYYGIRALFDNKDKNQRGQGNYKRGKRHSKNNPKVVILGGGTGLAILLRGLKQFITDITAIVTVADDGGSSGKLREDLGMLPPGDIRNCILALAEMEPTMEELLQYRFSEGSLKGQSFGNLFIASMNGISRNFEEAIKKISEVLAVTGRVYPVTLEDITLYAELENGLVVKGESSIPDKVLQEDSPIDRVFIEPKGAKGLGEAVEAIYNADLVLLGPGSLYTSIIPNLLIKNVAEALGKTKAKKIYICNMMTQPGETDYYGVKQHLEAILNHCPKINIDYIICNNGEILGVAHDKYQEEGARLILVTEKERMYIKNKGIEFIEENFVEIKNDYIRHDAIKLSGIIVELCNKHKNSR